MKNSFGNQLSFTLFGESHGDAIGIVIDGMTPGIPVDLDLIRKRLAERRPNGSISTARKEKDELRIVSGVFDGKTTGTPICILIPNEDTVSRDYEKTAFVPRPSHADYSAFMKYGGFQDYRGGGHFSGRLTAPLVAAGAIVEGALRSKGIRVFSHIQRIYDVIDKNFPGNLSDFEMPTDSPTLDESAWKDMIAVIEKARADGDSVGGIVETAVVGMPRGVGEPWFDSVEGLLSHAIFSIPAVKGIEFGDGFSISSMLGSEANDAFSLKNGEIITKTNRNGGINGGITNGMPLLFRTAIKPTPSILKEQDSVNLKTMKEEKLAINGRHDPAIVHRALPVINAVTAMVLADLLLSRFGTNFFQNKV